MSESPTPAQGRSTSRAEKLSILSAMLGPEAMARVRDAQPGASTHSPSETVEIDAERVAWHRNRLLERLRKQGGPQEKDAGAGSAPASAHVSEDLGSSTQAPTRDERLIARGGAGLDARLAKYSDLSTLSQEHPAVITRLMKKLSRDDRVEALKSLPGPLARSIVRRLR